MEDRLEEANQKYTQVLQNNAALERNLTGLTLSYKKSLQKKEERIQELKNALATYRPKNRENRYIDYSNNNDPESY